MFHSFCVCGSILLLHDMKQKHLSSTDSSHIYLFQMAWLPELGYSAWIFILLVAVPPVPGIQ